MKRSIVVPALLAGLVALSAPLLRAEDAPLTPKVPPANPAAAMGMAQKHEAADIKAALDPLREKLQADRKALRDAKKSEDKEKIDAAMAQLKADRQALRDKMMELRKSHPELARRINEERRERREERKEMREDRKEDRQDKKD
jgi:hypothetical protein